MKNIAVFCTSISAVAFRDCFQGIRECAVANNGNVFFFASDRMVEGGGPYGIGENNIFNAADLDVFDGAILLSNTFVEDENERIVADLIEKSGKPAVSIEGKYPKMYNFRIDNRRAMYDMVHHFIQDHGYKRINFVTGPLTSQEAKDRYAGYRDAMNDYQLEFSDEQIYEGDYMPNSGREAAMFFLDQDGPLPEAIVCSNDYMAMGVTAVLQEKGIKVGEQIGVSGYDDSQESKFVEPRLTSVSRENYKAGYAACKKLLSGLEEHEVGTVKNLQTNVIRRESCGCESREEYSETKFRRNYYKGSDRRQYFMLETRRLFAELTRVRSIEEYNEVIRPHIKQIKCEDFYLCLSNEWEGIHSGQDQDDASFMPGRKDDYISQGFGTGTFLAFSYSTHSHKNNSVFGIRQLIEGLKEKSLARCCFVVMPVHFSDRMFGYCIVSNSEYVFENPLFQSWVQVLGYGLETVRKERLIDSLSRKLDSLWIYDNLTGLYNRDGFNKYAMPIWMECMQKEKSVTLFFVDLDDLKSVNDKYGHDTGDKFVKAIANILKRRKRHGEVIMRFGGDEYVILACDLTEEDAKEYCDSLYAYVDDYNRMHNLPADISITIGYCQTVPKEGDGLDLAIEAADAKRYEARREKES